MGYCFKMIRIDTRRISTKVINIKTLWYWSLMKNVRVDVRPHQAVFPISQRAFGAKPVPTQGMITHIAQFVHRFIPRFWFLGFAPVVINEFHRFPDHPSPARTGIRRKFCWFAATTHAQTRGIGFGKIKSRPRRSIVGRISIMSMKELQRFTFSNPHLWPVAIRKQCWSPAATGTQHRIVASLFSVHACLLSRCVSGGVGMRRRPHLIAGCV